MQSRLIHHILTVGLACRRLARMFAARQLIVVMLGQMEGLVGSVDLGVCGLLGEGLDLCGVWMFRQLLVCLILLQLPNFFLHFLNFCLHFCDFAFGFN